MSCVIFGAGKIARGFIGHLLDLSDIEFTFVEKFDPLVDLINERKEYTVNVLGHSEKNCIVKLPTTGIRTISATEINWSLILILKRSIVSGAKQKRRLLHKASLWFWIDSMFELSQSSILLTGGTMLLSTATIWTKFRNYFPITIGTNDLLQIVENYCKSVVIP